MIKKRITVETELPSHIVRRCRALSRFDFPALPFSYHPHKLRPSMTLPCGRLLTLSYYTDTISVQAPGAWTRARRPDSYLAYSDRTDTPGCEADVTRSISQAG